VSAVAPTTKVANYPQAHLKIRQAIAKHVQGYDNQVTELLVSAIAGGHVLLEGVPGVAKTTLAKSFATILGLSFKRIQFTQDLLPADITGHYVFDQAKRQFTIRKGPIFANVILADEINRAPAKAHSALLEAMEERQVTIEGTTLDLPDPFFVVATLNPIDTEGVYRLPEAQLDRFVLRSRMNYLDAVREVSILEAEMSGAREHILDPMPATFLAQAQAAAAQVKVTTPLLQYMQRLTASTRSDPAVRLGASPRAMVQMLRASRAMALLSGRNHAVPDDIKWVAQRILPHRMLLNYDAEEEGTTKESIVATLLNTIEVPKGLAP
jgi:MoxR-like ATPase